MVIDKIQRYMYELKSYNTQQYKCEACLQLIEVNHLVEIIINTTVDIRPRHLYNDPNWMEICIYYQRLHTVYLTLI